MPSKSLFNKRQRQLDSICHQKNQPTIFQLKGVIILKDFDSASKIILSDNPSQNNLVKALKIFKEKKPSLEWFGDKNNKKVCQKIGQIARSTNVITASIKSPNRRSPKSPEKSYLPETIRLASEVRSLWREHIDKKENCLEKNQMHSQSQSNSGAPKIKNIDQNPSSTAKLRQKSMKLIKNHSKFSKFTPETISNLEYFAYKKSSTINTNSKSTIHEEKYKSKIKLLIGKIENDKQLRKEIRSANSKSDLKKLISKII